MTAWGLILDVRPKEERKIQKKKKMKELTVMGQERTRNTNMSANSVLNLYFYFSLLTCPINVSRLFHLNIILIGSSFRSHNCDVNPD